MKPETKFYQYRLDNLLKRHTAKSSELIVATIADKFNPVKELYYFSMSNYCKYPSSKKEEIQSHLKWRGAGVVTNTEKNEQNIDLMTHGRSYDDRHPYLSSSNALIKCGIFAAQTTFTMSSNGDTWRADNKARRRENCCSTGLVEGNATEVMLGYGPREDAASVNCGVGNHDLASSCKNEEIEAYHSLEDNSVAAVIPGEEVQDPSEKQAENNVYLAEFEMEKETMSEAT